VHVQNAGSESITYWTGGQRYDFWVEGRLGAYGSGASGTRIRAQYLRMFLRNAPLYLERSKALRRRGTKRFAALSVES
jgi:hypothetical protein